jgi:hypothetical protein
MDHFGGRVRRAAPVVGREPLTVPRIAPEWIRALMAVLLIACLASGCGGAATAPPGIRYENRAWTVVVPDDLGLVPIYKDPGMNWASGLVSFLGADTSRTGLSFDAEAQACDGPASNRAAQAILTRVGPGSSPTAETKRLGANDVAIGVVAGGASGRLAMTAAVICGRQRVIIVTAIGLSQADVERVLQSFVLRDPVSNELDPPRASSS